MEDPEGQSCQEGPGTEVAGYWPHLEEGAGAERGRGKEGKGQLGRDRGS